MSCAYGRPDEGGGVAVDFGSSSGMFACEDRIDEKPNRGERSAIQTETRGDLLVAFLNIADLNPLSLKPRSVCWEIDTDVIGWVGRPR